MSLATTDSLICGPPGGAARSDRDLRPPTAGSVGYTENNGVVVDVRAQAGVASVAVGAHSAATSVRAQAGAALVGLTAHARSTVVRTTVHAVADAIHPTGATTADLQILAALLNEAIRTASPAERVVKEIEQQMPLFGSFGRLLQANQGLIALIALVVTVMTYSQDRANNARVGPPLSVTVHIDPPDRTEVERIVEEKLREQHVPVEAPATETPEREPRTGSRGSPGATRHGE